MQGFMARPSFKLQQLGKTGDQERFLVQVKSTSGGNGLPYDEFILSISGTRLAVWLNSGTDPTQAAEQLAGMVIELHGNAAKFSDNYFFHTDNTDSAESVEEVVEAMQKERNLTKFIDQRDSVDG